ncbi:MAG TPA: zinc ribbon domain-containing protein, partial [Candidatus Acidoferrum sp.]|nr:zinc ribbon domain-containing protein [Candidatus Acidoferrum sp.]
MQCSRCAAENDAAASVCVSCGLSFSLRCPGCGGELPAAARFCPACGRPLTALPAPPAAVVTPPAEAARTPETTSLAERRQVTVLFSDVVNFTMQSDKQDAEDVRDRMDALWA